MFWIFRVAMTKTAAMTLLGREVYLRVFQQVRHQRQEPSTMVTRVINGDMVGPAMDPENGEASIDPAMCQHPFDKMKTRGNKNDKWWTCILCQSRWKRLPLPPPAEGPPTDEELMGFGKHSHLNFKTVYETKAEYVQWVLMTVETGEDPSSQMRRFAKYACAREAEQATPEDRRRSGTPLEEYQISDDQMSDGDDF